MLYSALINVMVKAARRAGRSLKRDLGEIEHLQVSLKGPANFVSLADKRAERQVATLFFLSLFTAVAGLIAPRLSVNLPGFKH